MKPALIRFLHLFMAVVVLLSSMGFGMIEHSCQMRGKLLYSVHNTPKSGCKLCRVRSHETGNAPTVNRTDCCKDESRYTKVDTNSSLSHQLVKLVKVVSDRFGSGMATVLVALINWSFVAQTNVPTSDYASPPPLSGRHLLAFVQSFLI